MENTIWSYKECRARPWVSKWQHICRWPRCLPLKMEKPEVLVRWMVLSAASLKAARDDPVLTLLQSFPCLIKKQNKTEQNPSQILHSLLSKWKTKMMWGNEKWKKKKVLTFWSLKELPSHLTVWNLVDNDWELTWILQNAWIERR